MQPKLDRTDPVKLATSELAIQYWSDNNSDLPWTVRKYTSISKQKCKTLHKSFVQCFTLLFAYGRIFSDSPWKVTEWSHETVNVRACKEKVQSKLMKAQGTLREMTMKRSADEQPAGPSVRRPKHK